MDFTKEQTKEIRRRIKRLIVANDMQMREFYEKSGVSSSLFSQYGTGKSAASMLSVQRMANAVNADIDVLLSEIENEQPAPTDGDGLNDDEKLLIDLFRQLPEDRQGFVIQQLQGLSLLPASQGGNE